MKDLINKLASAAEQGHTRGDIHQEGEQKLRQALLKKEDAKAKQNKRQVLSKAIAITAASLLKLKIEYDVKEVQKGKAQAKPKTPSK